MGYEIAFQDNTGLKKRKRLFSVSEIDLSEIVLRI